MLKHGLIYINPYGDGRQILSFNIPSPYEGLNIIQSVYNNVEDISSFIGWLENEVIEANVPDYSILFGSTKSKIAEYVDGKIVGRQEFETKDFLEACYAWRDFLKVHSKA